MTTQEILDGIFRKQHEIGMTNQQFSDASGVPKASIERIKRGDTANPTIETILSLSAAVGFTFSNHPEQLTPVPDEAKIRDPMTQHMISFYERQAIAYEERLKRQMAHFNMLLAEKTRTIHVLAVIIGLMITGFISILLIDLATPELGWFPHDANSITIGLAIMGVLGLIIGMLMLKKKTKD